MNLYYHWKFHLSTVSTTVANLILCTIVVDQYTLFYCQGLTKFCSPSLMN